MAHRSAHALAWVDFETTNLPDGLDYSGVSIMEVALLVTDFDLNRIAGFHSPVKLDRKGALELKSNEYVLNMHRGNNLIKDCQGPDALTLEEAEAELIATFQTHTSFEPGEFMIAGSGVAAFDQPLIKALMPNLARWFAYYPFDIGIERRVSTILNGSPIVNPTPESSRDDAKTHRAWDDVQAHLKEAHRYRDFYRNIPPF